MIWDADDLEWALSNRLLLAWASVAAFGFRLAQMIGGICEIGGG